MHKLPKEKIEETADLINEEWPRSRSSRVANLERSRDALPLSVVLLQQQQQRPQTEGEEAEEEVVVGHAKLSKVDEGAEEDETALLVESVVVRRSLRGQGLGRKVMEGVEAEALRRGFNVLYLATTDQVPFYTRLGFVPCDHPVSSLGFNAKRINTFALGNLVSVLQKRQQDALASSSASSASSSASGCCANDSKDDADDDTDSAVRCAGAFWLKKRLS